MKIKKSREDLSLELKELQSSAQKIHDQIKKMDHDEDIKELKPFIGKCYKKIDNHKSDEEGEMIYSIFIYGINESTCELHSISIYDFSGGKGHTFGIEYHYRFNPIRDDFDEYQEITKEEFNKDFVKILQCIMSAVNTK